MSHRLAALGFMSLVATSGCASALQRSVKAYERGDFHQAAELLKRVEPNEGSEIRAAIADGAEFSCSYLLRKARVMLERGGDAKPLREALIYYRAALAIMPDDYPQRAATQKKIAKLEREIVAAQLRQRGLAGRFASLTAARDYAAAIEVARELVDLVSSVGSGELEPAELLLLAQRAMGDGEHERAVQLVELADRLRQTAESQPGEDMGEVARVAAALRYFRRVAEKAAEAEAGRDPPPPRRTAGAKSTSRKKPAVDKTPASQPQPAPEEVESPEEKEADVVLQECLSLWKAGKRFEALLVLDAGIATVGARFGLEQQRAIWQPARAQLIAEFTERGEAALGRESSAEARDWYERILELDPGHELARDRMRKLDKLQRLQDEEADNDGASPR